MNIKRAVIFAHYDKNNIIQDYVIYYLKELKKNADYLVFVSDSNIGNKEAEKINEIVDYKIISKHNEYDFGSYKRGYSYLIENNLLAKFDELIIANDSCYAPLFPFENMFKTMTAKNLDAWGVTYGFNTYFNNKKHLQSYFCVFKQNIFTSKIFKDFMLSVKKEKNKKDIVINYEYGLSACLDKLNAKYEAYSEISKNNWLSYLLRYDEMIKKEHLPFLKKSIPLMTANVYVNIKNLEYFINNETNYNFSYIKEDIDNNKENLTIKKLFIIIIKYFLRNFIIATRAISIKIADYNKNKIWIDVSFNLKNVTGVGKYILTLFNALELNYSNYKPIELKLPQNMKLKPIFQIIWLNTIVYILACCFKPDIIISPSYISPFIKRKRTKYITVIHDLIFDYKDYVTKRTNVMYSIATKQSIKTTDIIVAVSETTKNEIIKKYAISPEKIKVVYNSIDKNVFDNSPSDNILAKYNIKSKEYILSVATLAKHKNIPSLVNAFINIANKHPNIKLVLVGKMGNEIKENLAIHPNIILTGYVKDEDLPSLYKNALLYVFPSLCEGFGIPIIEAQYCNCPVLCSDIPVFREVAGESAEFFEPNTSSLAIKMESLINNSQKFQELKNKGVENIKRFEINNIAEQLSNIIN